MTQPSPSPTVYSWYLPEVEDLVGDLALAYPHHVYRQNYSPGLDNFHTDLMRLACERMIGEVCDDSVEKLNEYHQYYTNGSSEGLFHLLARHKTFYPEVPLYQFEGEYQGYGEYARTLGMEFHTVPLSGVDLSRLAPGVFFVSVPSAIDGNNLGADVIERITDRHYVVLDVAYAGMADTPKLKVNDRVAAVVGSMSKPFGLYYHRIGFLWARDPVQSLYGNKWFKNIWSITVGAHVLRHYKASDLAKVYRPWQESACREASNRFGVSIEPSEVWLLGHYYPNSEDSLPASISPFKRGLVYRFCLTPYYMYWQNTMHPERLA